MVGCIRIWFFVIMSTLNEYFQLFYDLLTGESRSESKVPDQVLEWKCRIVSVSLDFNPFRAGETLLCDWILELTIYIYYYAYSYEEIYYYTYSYEDI